jgi:plasmid stabilization system protein ParE
VNSSGYTLSAQAQVDVQEIWWYVFEFQASDKRADAIVDRIFETVGKLAERPSLGRPRERAPGQLAFPSEDDLIVYRSVGDEIEISRVCGADGDLRANPG